MSHNKVHLGLRVPEAVRDALGACAEAHGVTMTDVVLGFVVARLVADGYLTTEPEPEPENGEREAVDG